MWYVCFNRLCIVLFLYTYTCRSLTRVGPLSFFAITRNIRQLATRPASSPTPRLKTSSREQKEASPRLILNWYFEYCIQILWIFLYIWSTPVLSRFTFEKKTLNIFKSIIWYFIVYIKFHSSHFVFALYVLIGFVYLYLYTCTRVGPLHV